MPFLLPSQAFRGALGSKWRSVERPGLLYRAERDWGRPGSLRPRGTQTKRAAHVTTHSVSARIHTEEHTVKIQDSGQRSPRQVPVKVIDRPLSGNGICCLKPGRDPAEGNVNCQKREWQHNFEGMRVNFVAGLNCTRCKNGS